MNYYILVKTAGPKEKIGKYKIKDSILVYFIRNIDTNHIYSMVFP